MPYRLNFTLNPDHPFTLAAAYRALFSWGLARAQHGIFIVSSTRTLDEEEMLETLEPLEWLGLDWDEGIDVDGPHAPYVSGARHVAYAAASEQLLAAHAAVADGEGVRLTGADPALLVDAGGEMQPLLTAVVDAQQWHITHQLSHAQTPLEHQLHALLGADQPQTVPLPPLSVESPLPVYPHRFHTPTLADLRAADVHPRALFSALLAAGWAQAPRDALITRYDLLQQPLEATLGEAALLTGEGLAHYNRLALASLSLEALAADVRPHMEEMFGDLPRSPAWLAELLDLIRADLSFVSQAPELAGWAFPDGYEFSSAALTLLADPGVKRPLATLMAELSQIVLLDQATAQVILRSLAQRFDPDGMQRAVYAALIGQLSGPALERVMGLLGKAECLRRLRTAVQ